MPKKSKGMMETDLGREWGVTGESMGTSQKTGMFLCTFG